MVTRGLGSTQNLQLNGEKESLDINHRIKNRRRHYPMTSPPDYGPSLRAQSSFPARARNDCACLLQPVTSHRAISLRRQRDPGGRDTSSQRDLRTANGNVVVQSNAGEDWDWGLELVGTTCRFLSYVWSHSLCKWIKDGIVSSGDVITPSKRNAFQTPRVSEQKFEQPDPL